MTNIRQDIKLSGLEQKFRYGKHMYRAVEINDSLLSWLKEEVQVLMHKVPNVLDIKVRFGAG